MMNIKKIINLYSQTIGRKVFPLDLTKAMGVGPRKINLLGKFCYCIGPPHLFISYLIFINVNQRKFKLVKRRAVYYQNVIPPSLLNCENSLRTPTDSMMYQGGPWNEKNSYKLFLWDMYRTRGLEITKENILIYQYVRCSKLCM